MKNGLVSFNLLFFFAYSLESKRWLMYDFCCFLFFQESMAKIQGKLLDISKEV